ncbi:conserved hypothetical protein [Verticillium alfalfae VaMs.102]|uniref:Uncharacterized protein n=1 Tax=Verticillium alfalfae (strain VaMs.102 / ATCC MYA-4576 / FGSC 10136) TaxID=526221 RepID=C9S984_VERA1|nr:conserved hypothetical protein [Verticillium alfalfae VaMs.102]EEY14987.1 conserved hypothetical protein [Verticillium alfalfae VaMs.102]
MRAAALSRMLALVLVPVLFPSTRMPPSLSEALQPGCCCCSNGQSHLHLDSLNQHQFSQLLSHLDTRILGNAPASHFTSSRRIQLTDQRAEAIWEHSFSGRICATNPRLDCSSTVHHRRPCPPRPDVMTRNSDFVDVDPWETQDKEDTAEAYYNQPLRQKHRILADENLRLKRLLRENGITWSPIATAHIHAVKHGNSGRMTRRRSLAAAPTNPYLPTEVLLRILKYALTAPLSIFDPLSKLRPDTVTAEEKARGNQIAIHFLATCRAMHTEGTRILWGHNSFTFTSPEALRNFAELDVNHRKGIKSVTFRIIAQFYDDKKRPDKLPMFGNDMHNMASHELGCSLNELYVTGLPIDDPGVKASAELTGLLRDEGLYMTGVPAYVQTKRGVLSLSGHPICARVIRAYKSLRVGSLGTSAVPIDDELSDSEDTDFDALDGSGLDAHHSHIPTMPSAPAQEGHPTSHREDKVIWKRVPISRNSGERRWVEFCRSSGYPIEPPADKNGNDDDEEDEDEDSISICPCCGEPHPGTFLDQLLDEAD